MAAAPDVAPAARNGARFARAVDSGVLWFACHWPACLLMLAAPLVALPVAAPLLASGGYHLPARAIYTVFRLACHQRPERSFYLAGEQLAVCQRDIAIFGAALLALGAGATVPRLRRATPAPLRLALLATLPLAVDGLTQLAGLRESTATVRVITGVVFVVGWAWFAMPRLEGGFRDVADVIRSRRAEGSAP